MQHLALSISQFYILHFKFFILYSLPYFKEKEYPVLLEFMKQHPFVVLCGTDVNQKPVATQVPVLFDIRDGQLFLTGHIMRQTDHHKAFMENPEALVLFTGPHTYVSASWYTDPRQGSTWNYMTVHARGTLTFLPEEALHRVLERLTALFENNEQSPSLFGKLPESYINRLVPAITAFEIAVQSIENVFKLSQNRDEKSFINIIGKLMQGNEDAQLIAAEMKKRQAALYANNTFQNDET